MPDPTMADDLADLQKRVAAAMAMGGKDRLEKQAQSGKMNARERIAGLLDEHSFQEQNLLAQHRSVTLGMEKQDLPADGVVTGCGTVEKRPIHVASQDFTTMGGACGEAHADKIVEMMQQSLKTGSPFVFINDSGGARIQEGIDSLGGYARIFYQNVQLSGIVPQISMICGPCAGGAAYSPALTDFVIQTRKGQMFITGPQVIKSVTGEEVSADDLGGPVSHMTKSGVIHFIAEDDAHAIAICKKLLSFLPSNHVDHPPVHSCDQGIESDPTIAAIVPDDTKKGYDIRKIIEKVVDHGDFLEVQEGFAQNMVIGFGRVLGHTVGIVANNPKYLAGSIDINASDKAARFVFFCDAFGIPLVNLVDVPGFLPGTSQEFGGIIRHGAKLLHAWGASTVPKVTVIIRKAYGGAYIAMNSKHLGADRVAAWPCAEIAVMGAEGAAEIVFRKEITTAPDPAAKRTELIEDYRKKFNTPYVAAARRMVDTVIDPGDTRRYIALALEILRSKHEVRPPKKHANIPL